MYRIGIDLGGTNIAVGLVSEEGDLVIKGSVPTKSGRSFDEMAKDMILLINKLLKDANIRQDELMSIGIGVPGLADSSNGSILYCPNLSLKDVNVRGILQKYMMLPVYLGNDANCAALAESVNGAAKRTKHSITVTLGTGIGGGIVVNGKIYTGCNDAAAELGHIVIVSGGEKCSCGRKGCWEAYASATALIRQTKDAAVKYPRSAINKHINNDLNKIDAKTVFDVAKLDDEVAKNVVNQYIEYLAEGIANIINIFQPEIVVVGGGITNEGKNLIKPLRDVVDEKIYGKSFIQKMTQIRLATMGNDAGIVGAAMLS